MRAIGGVIIGGLTCVAGYPVINSGGFNLEGLLMCTGCCAIWLLACNWLGLE